MRGWSIGGGRDGLWSLRRGGGAGGGWWRSGGSAGGVIEVLKEGRRCWRREVKGLWSCRMCSRRGECAGGVEEWLGHDNMLCIRKDD